MKHKLITLLMIICAVSMVSDVTQAQEVKNPNSLTVPLYYSYPVASAVQYWHGKADTISSAGVKLGGATYVTATVTNSDTMEATIYFDGKPRGSTQWSLLYTDSIIKTVADTSEIKLRLPGTDRLGVMDYTFRSRLVQRDSSNTADSAQTYNFNWNWKP